MGGSPNFQKAKNKNRINKSLNSFKNKIEDLKYPDCVGKQVYDSCPDVLNKDVCLKCPNYSKPKNTSYALRLLQLKKEVISSENDRRL